MPRRFAPVPARETPSRRIGDAASPVGATEAAPTRRTVTSGLMALAALMAPGAAGAVEEEAGVLSEYLWVARPVIVFADTPNDPRLLHQLRELDDAKEALEERDVVVIVDTEPGPTRFDTTPLRKRFRPHDFSVLLVEKDGEVKLRRPSPISGSQLLRLIDRLPLRQQETGRR